MPAGMPRKAPASKPANRKPAKRRAPVSRPLETQAHSRQGDALRLKIAGLSYRAIGEKLGVHHSVAQDYVAAALAESAAKPEEIAHLREIERARLESLIARWLPVATAEALNVSTDVEKTGKGGELYVQHIELPDYQAGTKAAEILVKLSARLAALYGMDGPTKIDHGGALGLAMTAELAAQIAEARAARSVQPVEMPPAPEPASASLTQPAQV